jgi:hypothetical protein
MKIRHRFALLRVWSESLFPSLETTLIEHHEIWLWIFHGRRQAKGVGIPMKLRRGELKKQRKRNKRAPHPNLHHRAPKRPLLERDRCAICDCFFELDSGREFCHARTQQTFAINRTSFIIYVLIFYITLR